MSDASKKHSSTIKDWERLFIHLPHGIGMGYFIMLDAPTGIGFLILCVFYQLIEDWRIDDNSFHDVRGYMAGFPIGVALSFCMPLSGWLVGIGQLVKPMVPASVGVILVMTVVLVILNWRRG